MIWLLPFFLCWGSFLNVVAYRLVRGGSIIWPRSYCIHCYHQLTWYDLIPVLSWIMLSGRCRYCRNSISLLYPFIEVFTALSMILLVFNVPPLYIPAYFIFFSALIVTIRSDSETMLISRFVTLFLVPVAFLLSVLYLLPISMLDSMIGCALGYSILYGVKYLTMKLSGKEGIGQGDVELLAYIGSFVGPFGCWITLLIGSTVGSFAGLIYMSLCGFRRDVKIPFGPFLALGAMIFVLYSDYMQRLFVHLFIF